MGKYWLKIFVWKIGIQIFLLKVLHFGLIFETDTKFGDSFNLTMGIYRIAFTIRLGVLNEK